MGLGVKSWDFSYLKSMHTCPFLIFPEGCIIIVAAAAVVVVVLESPVSQHLVLKG